MRKQQFNVCTIHSDEELNQYTRQRVEKPVQTGILIFVWLIVWTCLVPSWQIVDQAVRSMVLSLASCSWQVTFGLKHSYSHFGLKHNYSHFWWRQHIQPAYLLGLQFSSVQFKMVSMCLEKPICTPHRLSEVSPIIAPETVRLLFFWLKIFSLALLKKIVERFLFSRFSSPGDRWCGVLGFVPAGSVSSSSTLQTPEQCHDIVCMCSFRRWMSSNYIVTWQSDFTSHSNSLFQRQGRNSVRLMHLWSGWNVPKESCGVHVYSCQTRRSFWRACRKILMGRQYIIWATGNQTDSVVTFSPPWSHGLCWPNHPHTSWDSIFLNDRLGFSLSPPGLLIILNNVFSNALT